MNPTSQFVVKKLIDLQLFGLDVSITNSSLAMIATTSIIYGLLFVVSKDIKLIPHGMQNIGEMLYEFIRDKVTLHAHKKAEPYITLIISVFLMILVGNLLGLIPGFYTFTSQIIITFALAMIVFLGVIMIGFKRKGWKFLRIFIHGSMPLPITLFIIPIEIISFFARPVSLCLRLCINMIAGHMILKIFATFASMLPSSSVLILPILLVLTLFEILVAILQAYIFMILTCIYLKDAV